MGAGQAVATDTDDPIDDWPLTDRIVCYCGCPHHLSSLRAASLIGEGYEDVYVIDEGFWEWYDRDYPMAGSQIDVRPSLRVVTGVADARFAGETVWIRHPPSGQTEAGPIAPDGSYRLELRFADVADDSVLVVETPGYSVSAPLSELARGVVTADAS